MDAPLDLVDRRERVLGIGEVDLDVVLGTRLPRAILREWMARTGDDAPAGRGETLHRRVADAAARPGEEQRAARQIGGGVRHGDKIRSTFEQLYRRFPVARRIWPAGYRPVRDKGGSWSSRYRGRRGGIRSGHGAGRAGRARIPSHSAPPGSRPRTAAGAPR